MNIPLICKIKEWKNKKVIREENKQQHKRCLSGR